MLCIINIIHVYTCILARVQCIYMTEAPRVLHFSAFIFIAGDIFVGYEPIMYTTNEDNNTVTLTIKLFSPSTAPRPFNLTVSTRDDTAGNFTQFEHVMSVIK